MVAKSVEISKQLSTSTLCFYADVSPGSFLTKVDEELFRLTAEGDTTPIAAVAGVDILTSDLLNYTNAGNHLGYAMFLIDWAAAAGALKLFVMKNSYFSRQV